MLRHPEFLIHAIIQSCNHAFIVAVIQSCIQSVMHSISHAFTCSRTYLLVTKT